MREFVSQVMVEKKRIYVDIGGFLTLDNLERHISARPQAQLDLDEEVKDALAIRRVLEQLGVPLTHKVINKYKMLYSRAKKR